MKYSYSKAKSSFNASDKRFIEDLIQSWKEYDKNQGVIIRNFKREHYIRSNLFIDLLKYLIAKNDLNSVNVHKYIYEYFENYTLSGGNPRISKISKLGFVLTEYSVYNNLKTNYLDIFNGDLNEIQIFIDALKSNKVDNFFDFISIKKMKESLWLTFDKDTNNPFCFLRTNERKEVYISLALSEYYRDTPIILFTINLDKHVNSIIKRASIFDAGDYKCFRPPPFAQKNHGYTNPHNAGKIKKAGKVYSYDKRPEVVCNSREIKFRHLENVIYL